jgi:SseB protein N-terminal domain
VAKKKARAENSALADALKAEDVVAVALALRSAGAIVPLLPEDALAENASSRGGSTNASAAQVRVFRRGDADRYMLLLFSSTATYEAMLPEETSPPVAVYGADELLDFLQQNEGVLEAVWFDVAGPHAMQADPADVIAALTLPRG